MNRLTAEDRARALRDRDVAVLSAPPGTAPPAVAALVPIQQAEMFALEAGPVRRPVKVRSGSTTQAEFAL